MNLLQTAQICSAEFFDKLGNRKRTDLVLSETFWKVQHQNEGLLIGYH